MDLPDYERKKFAIAEILRAASRFIPDKDYQLQERMRGFFARLAEDRFNLVVVGRFSRGKTSLMNAILGSNRLPTGIAPLTSVITTVAYGSKEQVVLKYESRILDKEVLIESLPQYITQQGNPGNVQRIKTAEIQLPAEILRRGFYFVDTPGLGSVIVENTLTTEAFLPEADAFLLVTSYESPLSEDEMRFFKAASSSGRHIFVVLNKHDMVGLEDRNNAIAFVSEQLRRFFGDCIPQLFSVSSTKALEAKRSHDSSSLAASGIPELEAKLIQFLLTEKSARFLVGMCKRARDFLRELPRSDEIAGLDLQLASLAKQIARESNLQIDPHAGMTAAFPNLHRLRSCEICATIAEKLWDFLRQYQYEIIVNRDEQQSFADRGGLCPFHSWEYESIASPYGICNAYPALLDRLALELREANAMKGPREVRLARMARLLPTQSDCIICAVRDKAEKDAVTAAAQRLNQEADVLHSPSATCLPHFVMLLAEVHNDNALRALVEHQATVFQRFSEDMRRYALKHDAVRRYLASQEETSVAQYGLLSVAGRRRVNFAPRRTGSPRSGDAEPKAEQPTEQTVESTGDELSLSARHESSA
jgi:small GTP-binding protein